MEVVVYYVGVATIVPMVVTAGVSFAVNFGLSFGRVLGASLGAAAGSVVAYPVNFLRGRSKYHNHLLICDDDWVIV